MIPPSAFRYFALSSEESPPDCSIMNQHNVNF